MEGLNNKVVIITGGGHGIGRIYCLGFARVRARVVVADIDHAAARRVTNETEQEAKAECLSVAVDVTEEASVKRMTEAVMNRFGRSRYLHPSASTRAKWERMILRYFGRFQFRIEPA